MEHALRLDELPGANVALGARLSSALRASALPLGAATAVSASFVATAAAAPASALPATGWVTVFLFLACLADLQRGGIPHRLAAPALFGALLLATSTGGYAAGTAAWNGAAVAVGILFVPFALGWIGTGHVVAAMALGAFWGADRVVPALWWMILVGGALAATRPVWMARLSAGFAAAASARLPAAVAMGLGAAAFQLWSLV